jgi:hypothetical protein
LQNFFEFLIFKTIGLKSILYGMLLLIIILLHFECSKSISEQVKVKEKSKCNRIMIQKVKIKEKVECSLSVV